MEIHSLPQQTISKLADLLSLWGGFYCNGYYPFARPDSKAKSSRKEKSLNARWVILGREHYHETSKVFPIASRRDVLKAVKLSESEFPIGGNRLTLVQRIDEKSHKVITWIIEQTVFEWLEQKTWLVIPESYLLSCMLKQKTLQAERYGSTLYFSNWSQHIVSAVKSGRLPDFSLFACMAGVSESPTTTISSSEEYSALLQQAVRSLSVTHLSSFFIKQKTSSWQEKFPWKKAGWITASFAVVYLMLSSAFLSLKESYLISQLEEQGETVTELLKLQRELKQSQLKAQQLNELLSQAKPYWNAWPLLVKLASKSVEIKGLDYTKGELVLRGVAPKSSEVQQLLNDSPLVESLSIVSPIVKSRAGEKFAYRVALSEKVKN